MNATAKYRWTITKVPAWLEEDGDKLVGITGPCNASNDVKDNPTRFDAYDADGEWYGCGMLYGDFDGMEPKDDFFGPSLGAVTIKINGEEL